MADVELLDHGPLAEIRLNRRAISTAMAEDLTTVAEHLSAEAASATRVRAVVLSSAAPDVFCVGADAVAVSNARNALRRGLDVDFAAGMDIEDSAWRATIFSADRREGVRAFVEKRKPDWR